MDANILENLKEVVKSEENKRTFKAINFAYSIFLNLALTFEALQCPKYLDMIYKSELLEHTIEYYVDDPLSDHGYETLKIINEYFSHMSSKYLRGYLDNNMEFIALILKNMDDACDLEVLKSGLLVEKIRILNRIFELGDEYLYDDSSVNKYVNYALNRSEVEALTKVQSNENCYVYDKAVELINRFFYCE